MSTPSGKIDIFSQAIASFRYDDCPSYPSWLASDEWLSAPGAAQWSLHLITHQPADKLHSQMDVGKVSLAHKVSRRALLHLNPGDAAARGICNGCIVRVFNAHGACLAGAVVDPGLMANAIVMPTGASSDPADSFLERHGNPNVLTLDIGTSRLAQAPSALSALVEVALWHGPLPEMRAHQSPEIMPDDTAR
ncbi:molybdopterin dinucleotide binding domain-containing protein [Verminephrobacter eiseniae]|uniref:molybdopterin dinucleotide binding domain-containing protein n=1 Tax=Verminephrobacter eiseniae TaxID=364317 RepID=UPI00223847BB|nr:molybdopterin dinucleotide binding domain-containing protein [Verminephrobacter eiseniae]MCW5233236.1 hypothetical protein [Verminephrobacter eiseniae]MCW5295210.1 hypothetical protein [Verminephrobacter eiseniae]MCW8184138.1 hypothetical protein [Verminephrobacter eiseniae]MCW8222689.1 hypothetical protein [Verminephrobacter eiseniae]MCW8234159.1 hypothetical protein [Verminephrobacter eiseniae]